jgi:hypothetical protein
MTMADEPEFRVGDMQSGGTARRGPKAGVGALDAQVFPTLSAFVSASDFRNLLDELAGQARAAKNPEVQAALQAAVRLLPNLRAKYGG